VQDSPPILSDVLPKFSGHVIAEFTDIETGAVRRVEQHNAITNGMLELLIDWMRGAGPAHPNYIALASGAVTLNDDDTQDSGVVLTSSGADQRLAQGIEVPSQTTVNSVLLYLTRVGASPGTLRVEIHPDDGGGFPSGTPVLGGVSSTVSINGIDSIGYEWIRFGMEGGPVLQPGTPYHLVLRSSGYVYDSGVSEVTLGVDQSAPGYPDGSLATFDGADWTAVSPDTDACFRVIQRVSGNMVDVVGEVQRNVITTATEQTPTTLRMLSVFSPIQAVGRHNMVGMFNAPSGGVLTAIANIDLQKAATEVMNIYWIVSVST